MNGCEVLEMLLTAAGILLMFAMINHCFMDIITPFNILPSKNKSAQKIKKILEYFQCSTAFGLDVACM